MPESDFRASMLRLRDDARLRIAAMERLIESIEVLYAMPPIGKSDLAPPKIEVPPPPRPHPPAPPATNGAGQTNDDRVLHALRNGPLPPKAISELTLIGKSTLQDVLARMMTAKTIQKLGTGPRNTVYRLTK